MVTWSRIVRILLGMESNVPVHSLVQLGTSTRESMRYISHALLLRQADCTSSDRINIKCIHMGEGPESQQEQFIYMVLISSTISNL